MDGGKAMVITAGMETEPHARPAVPHRATRELVLARNVVMREALGGRTWRGALDNPGAGPVLGVSVLIRFHDRDGRTVGAPLRAGTPWLAAGGRLHLQARLPPAAIGLRLQSLRWTRDGRRVAAGSGHPVAFGASAG